MVACAWTAAAQEEKSVTLDEVTVKGARVVQKVDGQWFYPSPQLIETSTNGYSLLAKLTEAIKILSYLRSCKSHFFRELA